MDKEKKEIRFLINEDIYNILKENAEKLDIPLASYIKSNIEKWGKNNGRRKKDK
jgi:hypothetical protein